MVLAQRDRHVVLLVTRRLVHRDAVDSLQCQQQVVAVGGGVAVEIKPKRGGDEPDLGRDDRAELAKVGTQQRCQVLAGERNGGGVFQEVIHRHAHAGGPGAEHVQAGLQLVFRCKTGGGVLR